MRRPRWKFLAGFALIILLATGGWYLARPNSPAADYLTARPAVADIEETVTALGALQPLNYVDVGAQVTGQIKKLHVAVGDAAKMGELLAEIDPTVYAARVEVDRARIADLKAQIEERQAQATLARLQYARNQGLFRERAVSEDVLQSSAAAVQSVTAQIKALGAQIRQTESTLRGDEANLDYTKIYAPISGTVVSLTAREGQTVNANQQTPVILRIADLNTMTVWTQVSEADVVKIKLGMEGYFHTLGRPDRRWPGSVRQVLPTPEVINNVVLYNVLFDVANPDGELYTQMSAQVFFVLARARGALLVPSAALQITGPSANPPHNRKTVRVLEAGRVKEREVAIGIMNRVSAQVLSGLSEADEVIVGVKTAAKPEPGGYRMPPRL